MRVREMRVREMRAGVMEFNTVSLCVLDCNIREINTVHNSFRIKIRGLDSIKQHFS